MISDLEAYVRLAAPADEQSPIALATATSADEAQAADGRQKTDDKNNKTGDQKIEDAH
jgi:hypothetical protein